MQRKLLIATISLLTALSLSACVKQQDPEVNEAASADDALQNDSPGMAREPTHHATLLDTYWKLLELQGTPVVTPEGMREAHFVLASSESRTHGFSGCNNFFGNYKNDSDSLSFSALGSTMMACAEGMDTEQAFLKALSETTRTTIKGQFMELYADDLLLARFEAVYL